MKALLDKELCDKYPEIFKDRYGDMKKTAMCWGIETDDGWYKLINKLCSDIMKACGKTIPIATQVKEKYGGLRFYIDGGDDDIFTLISKAEEKSEYICEICGEKGKIREKKGWFKTLCQSDAEKLEYIPL